MKANARSNSQNPQKDQFMNIDTNNLQDLQQQMKGFQRISVTPKYQSSFQPIPSNRYTSKQKRFFSKHEDQNGQGSSGQQQQQQNQQQQQQSQSNGNSYRGNPFSMKNNGNGGGKYQIDKQIIQNQQQLQKQMMLKNSPKKNNSNINNKTDLSFNQKKLLVKPLKIDNYFAPNGEPTNTTIKNKNNKSSRVDGDENSKKLGNVHSSFNGQSSNQQQQQQNSRPNGINLSPKSLINFTHKNNAVVNNNNNYNSNNNNNGNNQNNNNNNSNQNIQKNPNNQNQKNNKNDNNNNEGGGELLSQYITKLDRGQGLPLNIIDESEAENFTLSTQQQQSPQPQTSSSQQPHQTQQQKGFKISTPSGKNMIMTNTKTGFLSANNKNAQKNQFSQTQSQQNKTKFGFPSSQNGYKKKPQGPIDFYSQFSMDRIDKSQSQKVSPRNKPQPSLQQQKLMQLKQQQQQQQQNGSLDENNNNIRNNNNSYSNNGNTSGSTNEIQSQRTKQIRTTSNKTFTKQQIETSMQKSVEEFRFYMTSVQDAYKPPFQQDYFSVLFREHFIQTCQGLQYGKLSKPMDQNFLKNSAIKLGRNNSRTGKTIIFDLDETLVHCNEGDKLPADTYLDIKFPTGEIIRAGVNVRPFVKWLLSQIYEDFELIVFTASHACYANKVIDYLDPEKKYFAHRFYRPSCVTTKQGIFIKDLRIFSDRSLSDMVLIDNAGYSLSYQPSNGVPILSYYDNKSDIELKRLLPYLKSLKDVADVRLINKDYYKLHIFSDNQGPKKVYERLFLQQQ